MYAGSQVAYLVLFIYLFVYWWWQIILQLIFWTIVRTMIPCYYSSDKQPININGLTQFLKNFPIKDILYMGHWEN